ncbi:hypothetical protein ABIE78_006441 [Sinorhizobium fredii]
MPHRLRHGTRLSIGREGRKMAGDRRGRLAPPTCGEGAYARAFFIARSTARKPVDSASMFSIPSIESNSAW